MWVPQNLPRGRPQTIPRGRLRWLPGSTLLYCDYVRCIRLPESTPPSQNIPPLSTNICDPPRIYSSLPEYTPPFQKLNATLPESTPLSQNIGPTLLFNNYIRPRIYPSLPEYTPFSTTICGPPRIYPSLPEYTPFSTSTIMRPSQNLPLLPRIYPTFQQLYATLPESTPSSQNIPPLFNNSKDYATLLESAPPSQNIFQFWEQVVDSLTITKASRKGGIFSDWGVYSRNIAYI